MIRVGILGAGFMGQMHANCYANVAEAEVRAIADRDTRKAQEISRLSGAKAYDDFEDMLGNENLDMVDICLPTYMHKEFTIRAARRGLNILCEKPLCMNLKEADEMIKEVKKARVKFMVAHCIRFWPEYISLKEIVDKKTLGKIKGIYLQRLSPRPTWSWNNWLMQAGRSGGAILDLHIHDTDYLLYLLGRPKSVFARGIKDKYGWSHISTFYEYDNITAYAEGGWDMPAHFPFNMAFRAIFEKGVVDFGLVPQAQMLIYEADKKPYKAKVLQPEVKGKVAGGNIAALGGYFNEIKYFVQCIKNNKNPQVVTAGEARTSLKIVLAEIKSAQTGHPVGVMKIGTHPILMQEKKCKK